jgi:Fe-S oxidoreductase
MRCGLCRALCPTWEYVGWETGSPRGRMQIVKALLDEKIKANDYIMDRLYKCTGCGYCLWKCPPGVNTVDTIMAAREYLVSEGYYPKIIDSLENSIQEKGSIYDLSKETRNDWIEYTGVEDAVKIKNEADLVYFVGCVTSQSGRVMNVAAATSLIFNELNLDWTILKDEQCCGYPLLLSGKREYLSNLAKKNVEAIKNIGAKKVVTTCPGCYRTLNFEYPRILGEMPFKTYHVSQLLNDMHSEVKKKYKEDLNMVVTYHDPCDLGRLSQIYEAPRTILNNIPGIKLIELPKNRSLAQCCGGGGMLKATNPDIASKLAEKKVEDAKLIGAEAIVSACASCKQNIQDTIFDLNEEDIQTLDLTEIVAKAMGLEIL